MRREVIGLVSRCILNNPCNSKNPAISGEIARSAKEVLFMVSSCRFPAISSLVRGLIVVSLAVSSICGVTRTAAQTPLVKPVPKSNLVAQHQPITRRKFQPFCYDWFGCREHSCTAADAGHNPGPAQGGRGSSCCSPGCATCTRPVFEGSFQCHRGHPREHDPAGYSRSALFQRRLSQLCQQPAAQAATILLALPRTFAVSANSLTPFRRLECGRTTLET